jgi:hypothetical protein
MLAKRLALASFLCAIVMFYQGPGLVSSVYPTIGQQMPAGWPGALVFMVCCAGFLYVAHRNQ